MCKRGDVFYVDFGNEINTNIQSGKRPVVVVSNNKANKNSPVVTIVPITTKTRKRISQPTHVQIPIYNTTGLSKPSMALAEQVSGIDKIDLGEKIGEIDTVTMNALTVALQVQIGVFEQYN